MSMQTKRIGHITPAELKVFASLAKGPATIRLLCVRAGRSIEKSDYNTVQMLLERLQGKGLVTRAGGGRPEPYVWSVAEPAKVVKGLINDTGEFLEKLFGSRVSEKVLAALKDTLIKRIEPELNGRRKS